LSGRHNSEDEPEMVVENCNENDLENTPDDVFEDKDQDDIFAG